jgi:hypothetical protein
MGDYQSNCPSKCLQLRFPGPGSQIAMMDQTGKRLRHISLQGGQAGQAHRSCSQAAATCSITPLPIHEQSAHLFDAEPGHKTTNPFLAS